MSALPSPNSWQGRVLNATGSEQARHRIPATTPADTSASPEQMKTQRAKMQTTMNKNMAKMEAADAAMKTHMDTQQAAMKSDVEMKHAMIAQLQTMSDQIQQLNDRITTL